MDRVNLRPI